MLAPTISKADIAKATQIVDRARGRLMMNAPWFGSLALRLETVIDPAFPGLAATDGTSIIWNPREVLSIPEATVTTIVAHEVMHCALLHLFRLGPRDRAKWNIACDHAVNLALEENGFPFPPAPSPWQGLRDHAYDGMAAEQIYALLPDVPPPTNWTPDLKDPSSGEGGQDKGTMTATDWEIAAEQATITAQRAGHLPASMARLIKAARQPSVDWCEVLRRFIDHTVPSDYRWNRPNRRHLGAGLYLPGTYKENSPRFVVAVDTSGSMTQPMLNQIAGELTAILKDVRPERVDVVYCDADVAGTETFDPDWGPVELHAKGGGGTRFQPVFDWVEKSGEPPAALIYLTDLCSFDTPRQPEYPVLWGVTYKTTAKGPFGETVQIETGGG